MSQSGNVIIFGKAPGNPWRDASDVTNVVMTSADIQGSPLTLIPRDNINPVRWRTRSGGTTTRPVVGSTVTFTLSGDDARLVALKG